jgi:hypothetical protein
VTSHPTEQELLSELLRRYPPDRFRRYPRWRPGWQDPGPRRLRFLYVEMPADLLRATGPHFHQTWQRDGVALSCASGEGYFCSYRDRGFRPTGRTDPALAKQVEDLFGDLTIDPQSDDDVRRSEDQDRRRLHTVLQLPDSPPPEVVIEDLRRGTLVATLFTPFTYALIIVGLVDGSYPGEELFGKGELYLAAGVALTPAILLANQKMRAIRKAGITPMNLTSAYVGALFLLWLVDFTLWLLLTIASERSDFHSRWVAGWGGSVALLSVFYILSPFSRAREG